MCRNFKRERCMSKLLALILISLFSFTVFSKPSKKDAKKHIVVYVYNDLQAKRFKKEGFTVSYRKKRSPARLSVTRRDYLYTAHRLDEYVKGFDQLDKDMLAHRVKNLKFSDVKSIYSNIPSSKLKSLKGEL